MAEHIVMLQNVEENEEVYSLTGLVDGVQASALVNKRHIPKGLKGERITEYLCKELARAFEVMPPKALGSTGRKVSI